MSNKESKKMKYLLPFAILIGIYLGVNYEKPQAYAEIDEFDSVEVVSAKLERMRLVQLREEYYQRGRVAGLIYDYFGAEASTAIRVAIAESGLNCNATNWDDAKITGKPSMGVFQLNRDFDTKYYDCEYNIREAKKLFDRRHFQPWSTYNNNKYLSVSI